MRFYWYRICVEACTFKKNALKPLWSILAFYALLGFHSAALAQDANISISNDNFNEKWLEHLIKIKVDSVRLAHDCKPLINDSILYVASEYHAAYMQEKGRIGHYESDDPIKKTPQLRAEYFGAKNYGVGENVLVSPYNSVIRNKKKKIRQTNTYEALAFAIVEGWVNSPGHYKNMITPSYQITGVAVALDQVSNKVYACQKFARIQYHYSFSESKTLFPHSTFVPREPRTDFSGIPSELLKHDHPWKVRHNELKKCDHCEKVVRQQPPITLRYQKGYFILRVEDSEYVKQLLRKRKDGFAVEIVGFDDYVCGNPDYYEKPSRRNGQCKLNGTLLKPVYRNASMIGYRRKKRDKNIRFLSYITSADSIPFFQRFPRYKSAKFSSEFFELKLGKLPKNITGYWAHNLVYLQDKEVCHVDYFTGYCGAIFSDTVPTKFLALEPGGDYHFSPDSGHLDFEVPFRKNQTTFASSDIAPFTDSLSSLVYTIDSIRVKAYSSAEGDSIKNAHLQVERAKKIVEVLQEHQQRPIPLKIETATSWDELYHGLRLNRKWNFLGKLTKEELLQQLNNGYADSLEFMLQDQRKAEITLDYTIDVTDENLEYYIWKEYEDYLLSLRNPRLTDRKQLQLLRSITGLYTFTHRSVVEGKIDTAFLAGLPMPKSYKTYLPLCEKFILYGFQFPTAFQHNASWSKNKDALRNTMVKNHGERLSRRFIYNDCRLRVEELHQKKLVSTEDVQLIIDEMELISRFYVSSRKVESYIDQLVFNLNMILLNHVFTSPSDGSDPNITKCLRQIHAYYVKYDLINDSLEVVLARAYVHHGEINKAVVLLRKYANNEEALTYLMPLEYTHSSSLGAENYYQRLIALADQMETKNWCNLFLADCKIPFQAFDHEQLRNVFCAKCMVENDFMKELFE